MKTIGLKESQINRVINEEIYQMDKTIMTVSEEWMRAAYDKFNKLYWNGELPSNIYFRLNGRLKNSFARANFKYSEWQKQPDGTCLSHLKKIEGIEFSTNNKGETWVFENTMIHEMIHIADYFYHPEHFGLMWKNGRTVSSFSNKPYDAHGAIFFLKEAQRLSQYGWDIQKMVTPEEHMSLQKSDDYERKKEAAKKRKERERRKKQKEINRFNQLAYTFDRINNKSEIINTLIQKYTNNFTQPIGYREVNIGDLKLIFSGKYDWTGTILDVDSNDAQGIKYKAIIYVGESLMNAVKERGFGSIDVHMLFEDDYWEMVDLEDKYELY